MTQYGSVISEEELLPISALSHLVFCERRAMLVHLEGLWAENRFTTEGKHLHERTDRVGAESRGDIHCAYALRIRSFRLGLVGIADTVEFHRVDEGGVELTHKRGRWMPFPVEYKRGRPKRDHSDMVQLCAQALCLEEMLGGILIPCGALFYGQPRRRTEVIFTPELRAETEGLAARLHELVKEGRTPRAAYEKKCESCSLIELCIPKTTGIRKNVERYIQSAFVAEGST